MTYDGRRSDSQSANNGPFDAPFSFSRSGCKDQPDTDGDDPE
jgi:hypothetical protein